ncbi:helix-turn-helix transcriptional regulator [Dermacoccaceae bacterium W4C1]
MTTTLQSSVTLTPPVGPDPVECEEFSFGVGTADGMLVLRYTSGGALSFGTCRQDFLHQLYWSPDGVLAAARDGRTWYVGGDQALWVRRAVSHDVRAYGRRIVYRICLRRRPPGLRGLDYGVVTMPEAAGSQLQSSCREGVPEAMGLMARASMFDGLAPAGSTAPPAQQGGLGHAAAVARHLAYEPGDPATLNDWAGRLHISSKTLQRDFERSYGVSFSQWRTSQRLQLARTLLESEPVNRVAARVGYHSTSAFIVAFRREFGCTPKESIAWPEMVPAAAQRDLIAAAH